MSTKSFYFSPHWGEEKALDHWFQIPLIPWDEFSKSTLRHIFFYSVLYIDVYLLLDMSFDFTKKKKKKKKAFDLEELGDALPVSVKGEVA